MEMEDMKDMARSGGRGRSHLSVNEALRKASSSVSSHWKNDVVRLLVSVCDVGIVLLTGPH